MPNRVYAGVGDSLLFITMIRILIVKVLMFVIHTCLFAFLP